MSTPIIAFIPSVYEVTVTSETIVQKMLKRGNRPSLYQIDQWFEKGYTVCITEKTKSPPIKGRIKQVGPYRINECGEADILIEGHPFPIAIKDIKHFEVEEITNFPVPMILAPSSPLVNKIQTVVLVSDGERFIVNKQRLADIVPYFKTMFQSDFKESLQDEVDVSESLPPQQLKLILLYLDGQTQIDQNNVADLFILSDQLHISELNQQTKEYLIQNMTLEDINAIKASVGQQPLQVFVNNIESEITAFYRNQTSCPIGKTITTLLDGEVPLKDKKELTLVCEQVSFCIPKVPEPRLKGRGIADVLRIVKILGGKIESLAIENVRDSDMPVLVESLKENPQIRSLNISWQPKHYRCDGLTDKSGPLLAEIINSLPSLKNLKISLHHLTDNSLQLIADCLEHNTSLEEVDLSHNKFTFASFNHLVKKIETNETIKILRLNGCRIGKHNFSAKECIEPLSNNKTLKELHLARNHISDEGARAISTIIANNTILEVIDLQDNKISLEGREAIVSALRTNSILNAVQVNSVEDEQDQNRKPYNIILRGELYHGSQR